MVITKPTYKVQGGLKRGMSTLCRNPKDRPGEAPNGPTPVVHTLARTRRAWHACTPTLGRLESTWGMVECHSDIIDCHVRLLSTPCSNSGQPEPEATLISLQEEDDTIASATQLMLSLPTVSVFFFFKGVHGNFWPTSLTP
jgi:hypothetical protein